MLESVIPYEKGILFWVNGHHTAFLDRFMWMVSATPTWIPLMVFLVWSVCYGRAVRIWLPLLVMVGLAVFIGDSLNAQILRPYFHRARPAGFPGIKEWVRHINGYTGGHNGFMSSHATNYFSLALLMSLYFRDKWVATAVYSLAFLVCYSRMYLGVHFFTDLLGGAVLGSIISALLWLVYRKYTSKYPDANRPFSASVLHALPWGIWGYILILMLISYFL